MNKRPGPGWVCYVEHLAGRVVRAGRTMEASFASVRPVAGGEIVRTSRLARVGDTWSDTAHRIYRRAPEDEASRLARRQALVEARMTIAQRRAAAYPHLGDLADALFWQAKGDPTKFDAWVAASAAVKRRIPKE